MSFLSNPPPRPKHRITQNNAYWSIYILVNVFLMCFCLTSSASETDRNNNAYLSIWEFMKKNTCCLTSKFLS